MATYIFTKELQLNDVDRTTSERHLTGINEQNLLHRNFIHKIQERFHELGFGYMVGNINGCFNVKLYSTILSFQNQSLAKKRNRFNFVNNTLESISVNLTFKGTPNGKFDEETAKELSVWLDRNYRNSSAEPLIKWGKTWIRSEIAAKIDNVKKEVVELGGIFPTNSIACFRSPANTTITPGMKKTSLHLAALAVDFDEWRGMQNSETDYYFIADRDGEYWDVYVKTKKVGKLKTKEFYFYDSKLKKYTTKSIEGHFINISHLMFKEGLVPIKRKKGWESEFYFSEWWHFQDKDANDNNWESAMIEIGFSKSFLKSQNYINE